MDRIVETKSGALRCIESEGLVIARGVRFAEAPVGRLRFRPPVPAEPWTGVRDALEPGAVCPQNPAMLSAPGERQDEDCLFLNVWSPRIDGDVALPVMVWVHGGGFTTGSGSTPWYDGEALARRGVVVVTINYRLGAFGFLHLAEVGGSEFATSGNCGMLDQVLALEWVRDHIADFGGDPGRVTLFGESAGAMSVGTHLGMARSSGLFGRAILQSGASRNVSTPERATMVAERVMASVGAASVEELQATPIDALLGAQTEVAAHTDVDALPFQPVVDGEVLTQQPVQAIAAGAAANVDLIVGTTADEAKLFTAFVPKLVEADDAAVARRLGRLIESDPAEVVAVYRQRLGDAPPREVFDAVFTDRVFRMPAIELAEHQAAAGASVWMYLFGERSDSFDGTLGACHAIEIPFVWDNLDARGVGMLLGERTSARRTLAARLADAWVRFATSGDPVRVGDTEWDPYDVVERRTMWVDATSGHLLDDPMAAERRLWDVRLSDRR